MRILTILAALTLIAAASPVAADGIDASVRYLDEESSCGEEHSSTSDGERYNDSYWYEYREHHAAWCAEDFTYASASVAKDGETVAAASADGHEWSRDNSTRNERHTGWYTDIHSGSSRSSRASWDQESGWSRDVTVQTVAGDAHASRGCSSTRTYNDEYSTRDTTWRWGNESYHYGSGDDEYTFDSASECHESVTAGNATVARREECSSRGDGEQHARHREHDGRTWGSTYESHEGSYDCFNGVTADAAGEHARAGTIVTCAYDAYEATDHQESTWNSESTTCRSGVVASGPWGAHAFAGEREGSWQHCESHGNTTECDHDDYREGGVDAQWEKSPAGPLSLWFYRSLP